MPFAKNPKICIEPTPLRRVMPPGARAILRRARGESHLGALAKTATHNPDSNSIPSKIPHPPLHFSHQFTSILTFIPYCESLIAPRPFTRPALNGICCAMVVVSYPPHRCQYGRTMHPQNPDYRLISLKAALIGMVGDHNLSQIALLHLLILSTSVRFDSYLPHCF